jgi:hypothetical protein
VGAWLGISRPRETRFISLQLRTPLLENVLTEKHYLLEENDHDKSAVRAKVSSEPGESPSRVRPESTARERRRLVKRIWWTRVFIALMLSCLVFGWTRLSETPVFTRTVCAFFSLLWTVGSVIYLRYQNSALDKLGATSHKERAKS